MTTTTDVGPAGPGRAAPPAPGTPWSDADPFGPEILEDPTGFHASLRDIAPVVHLRRWDVYGMGRYEHVHAALTDWQRFQSGAGVGWSNFRYEKPWRPPSLLLEADPPRHDAPRAVLSAILGPRALRRLRDRWLTDAEALVDALVSGHTVVDTDALTSLAEAFPLQVFPDAVGMGKEGRENLLPYGDHLFNAFGPPNELVAKGNPKAPDLLAWVIAQCARDKLTDDGFGAAIWAAADRGEITPAQAPLVVRSLLSAGVDTTVHGIAAVLYALATHPAEWQRLRAQPSLARVAFDEAVRWESPVQTFFRTATTDVTVGDTVIPDGAKILMFLASANRDPRHWRDPDRFDLARDPSGHVGFGFGLHQCVGQHVARLEAEALLTALAARVETIELVDTPRRHHNNTMRGFQNLPVRLRTG